MAFAHLISTLASYFDHLAYHSRDPKQHLAHLRQVFAVIRKYNFTLRPEKCVFYQEVELLGHLISSKGIKPLDKLLKKDLKFDMGHLQQEAWNYSKLRLLMQLNLHFSILNLKAKFIQMQVILELVELSLKSMKRVKKDLLDFSLES
jgi:hypothetical protein